MKINFNNDMYPKKLEKYYSKVLLDEALREKANLRYEYDPVIDKLRLETNKDIIIKVNIPKSKLPSDVKTQNDFDIYLYNSQSEIKLDKVENKAFIEGHEIHLDQLVISKEGEFEDNKISIVPMPFDKQDIIQWELDFYGEQKSIILKRAPNKKSAYTKKYVYKSSNFEVNLYIDKYYMSLIIDVVEKNKKQIFVSEIIEAYSIQHAFLNGKLLINGINLSQYKENKNENKNKLIEISKRKSFWEKVSELEHKLNVKFKIRLPISNEENIILDKLIVSLLFKESVREQGNITSVKLRITNDEERNKMKRQLQNEEDISTFAWKEVENFELFNEEINLFKFFATSNIRVKEVEELKDSTLKVFVKARNDDGMIVSSKFYLMNDNEDIKIDQKAKYLQEYWEKIYSNS
ncbi:hypothetical protein BU043_10885 [Staphylococcus simulans]|uniref:abortive infection system toxin AbiGii family protein n=1 Tax=Staphylococcus simulans TaxID=1286 RepID=UPI000E682326|nr:abortive infection system toxin AbiGii family protein [Staphylococcus simulans]RIN40147.1 hypothetical protein BU043_10885 [Staphylococcus simulans]